MVAYSASVQTIFQYFPLFSYTKTVFFFFFWGFEYSWCTLFLAYACYIKSNCDGKYDISLLITVAWNLGYKGNLFILGLYGLSLILLARLHSARSGMGTSFLNCMGLLVFKHLSWLLIHITTMLT